MSSWLLQSLMFHQVNLLMPDEPLLLDIDALYQQFARSSDQRQGKARTAILF